MAVYALPDGSIDYAALRLWLVCLTLAVKVLGMAALVWLPPSSHLRDLTSSAIVVLYFVFYRDTQLLRAETLKITLNTFSVIQVGNIVDVVSITRLSFPSPAAADGAVAKRANGHTEAKPAAAANGGNTFSTLERLSWALSTIWNFRGVGTPQQVKGIPVFRRGEPTYVPGRTVFLLQRSLSIAVRLAVLRAWGDGWPLLDPRVDMAYPKAHLLSRLPEVTAREMRLRAWATVLFWTRGYLNHATSYDVVSVATVGLGISQPRSWPPMYRSLWGCNTMRTWWGTTWHQLLRKQLTSFSNFIVHDTCRLRRHTLLARYMTLFLTFWISGLYHIMSDGWEIDSGVIRFFVMQAVAIAIEDAVQELHRRAGRPLGRTASSLAGYIWVAFLMVWTGPWWRYPVVAYRFRTARI